MNENINEKKYEKTLENSNINTITDPSNLSIIIKNHKKYQDITLLVKSDDNIQDIIDKYKAKLQNGNIIDISFQKEDGKYISPLSTIKLSGIKDMEKINAIICENENNQECSKKEKQDLIDKMKMKMKEGLIPIIIYNPELGNESFFVNPKLKFQSVATQFCNKYPGKNFFFLFGGQQISQEKTIEELKLEILSKILAQEM